MTSQPDFRGILFISETQNNEKRYCNEEKNEPVCLSGMFRAATTQFHWGKIIILPSGPNFLDHKNWFPTVSKLSKDTVRTPCTIPLEKRWGEGVLWVLTVIPSVTLIRWNILIDDFLAWSGKHPVSFRKLQKETKAVVLMEKKNESVCFSGKLKTTTIQFSLGENMSFAIRPQISGSQSLFPFSFRAV